MPDGTGWRGVIKMHASDHGIRDGHQVMLRLHARDGTIIAYANKDVVARTLMLLKVIFDEAKFVTHSGYWYGQSAHHMMRALAKKDYWRTGRSESTALSNTPLTKR